MSGMGALIRRDVALALSAGGGAGTGLAFFALVVVLVPLGVGPEPQLLARIGGGIIWIAALLAALLSLDRLFQADWEDGTLDQLFLAPYPVEQIVLAKALAHWLTSGLMLVLVSPLLGFVMGLSVEVLIWLMAALAAGTPALSLIGAVGAALTVGLRRGGLLLSLLVLPLYVPTLIFGAEVAGQALLGETPWQVLGLTGVVSLLALAVGPFAAAAALRINAR